jgi:hypothetical protein
LENNNNNDKKRGKREEVEISRLEGDNFKIQIKSPTISR